jgi:hypothetical protein
MQRWGKDNEERAAVAQKAQDSYAIARQAMEQIKGIEAILKSVREELSDCRLENAELGVQLGRLQRQVDAMQIPIPKPIGRPRRVA